MLGFVFWHWPEPETRIPEYEQKLVTFHQALVNSRVPGVRASATFRVAGAPWLGPGRSGYEDWYFVGGYSALETLNLAAVTESRRASHDRVAQLAAGGAGGLYALVSGSGDMGALTFVTWLTSRRASRTPIFTKWSVLGQTLHQRASGGASSCWDRPRSFV